MSIIGPQAGAATELCTALQKGYRAVRFYPPDHPVATQALEGLVQKFSEALAGARSLELTVQEKALLSDGRVVYERDEGRDNLAFILFRDGVRSLGFHSGLAREEVEALVDCLAHAEDLDKSEQDLATVLWEQDFAHIDFMLADPLLEAEATVNIELAALENKVRESWQGVAGMDLRGTVKRLLDSGPPEETLQHSLLAEADLAAVERLLEEEVDVLDDFALVLSEVLGGARSSREVVSAARALRDLFASFLEEGEVARLNLAIRRLLELRESVPERGEVVRAVLEPLAGAASLRQVVFSLDAKQAVPREDVDELLRLLGDWACPAMVELLISSNGKASRKCLLNALTGGDGPPLNLIAPHLADFRWYVARNMVYLLRYSRHPDALVYLERAFNYPDERVRREALRGLTSRGGERTAQLIVAALDDPSSSVRAAAARAAVKVPGKDVQGILLRHLQAKDLLSRPDSEIEALLDALGRLGDDRAVAVLDGFWENRRIFRSRPLSLRLRALRTLARLGTAAAVRSLEKASCSREAAIRAEAVQCLADCMPQAVVR